jgi:transcriptional antiterminator NusG
MPAQDAPGDGNATAAGDEADDSFILEKVAAAKAAKKKKAAAPRTRKPSKREKERLPDLGDGSGYEPPELVTKGMATAALAEGEAPVEGEEAFWYAVHCYSGYENKVKHSLEQRIETMGMAGRILEIVVPTEEEIEVRDGKRKTVERRVFPGYVLVRMKMSEDSWHVVRNTPGVTRFIGMGNRPQPLSPQEVNQILRRMEAEAPKIKVSFKTGQKVRITDGPFADFMGLVDKIDTERAKVVVLVSFFGRETPVELDFLQVERM